MNNLIKTLHDICVLDDTSNSIKEQTTAKYLGRVFTNLVSIIAMSEEYNDDTRKGILFETYCFNIKRIIDIYKDELLIITNIKTLNKIRNTITHQPINFYVRDGTVSFLDSTLENKIDYNVYYMDKNGFINTTKFMVYYLLVLSKEVGKLIGEHEFTGLGFNDKLLKKGFDVILSNECLLNDEHDEYIEIVSNLIKVEYNSKSDVESAKKWFESKGVENYPVDYMHILISRSYSIPFNDSKDKVELAISYCNKALDYIDAIVGEYTGVWVYKRSVYRNLSSYYYSLNEGEKCLKYAELAMEFSRKETFVSLKDQILLHSTLANALSLIDKKRENNQLKTCFSIFDECYKNDILDVSEHKNMIYGNYVDSCFDLRVVMGDYEHNCILAYLSQSIPSEYKVSVSYKLARYYLCHNYNDKAKSVLGVLLKSRAINNVDKNKIRADIESI
ncbi:TPA: hypothetical protein NGT44_002910 [Vibrio parahaemolyticus]|nr:hypothetical protein [Vibrio parahaemolyticus]